MSDINDRVMIKETAMAAGRCKAEYVDQLCQMCIKASAQSCPFVPPRDVRERAVKKEQGAKEIRTRS